MISENTKKDLFWYPMALFIAALHLGTAYFIVFPRDLGILYGVMFLAISGLMWYYHEEAGLGPCLLTVAAVIPIGHGYLYFPHKGWISVKMPMLIYAFGFGAAFLIWLWQKSLNYFCPEKGRF